MCTIHCHLPVCMSRLRPTADERHARRSTQAALPKRQSRFCFGRFFWSCRSRGGGTQKRQERLQNGARLSSSGVACVQRCASANAVSSERFMAGANGFFLLQPNGAGCASAWGSELYASFFFGPRFVMHTICENAITSATITAWIARTACSPIDIGVRIFGRNAAQIERAKPKGGPEDVACPAIITRTHEVIRACRTGRATDQDKDLEEIEEKNASTKMRI